MGKTELMETYKPKKMIRSIAIDVLIKISYQSKGI